MKQSDAQDDVSLARLLRIAGPRQEPAQDIRDEVLANVHAAWQAQLRRRRRKRSLVFGAIAASLLAAITLFAWLPSPDRVMPVTTVSVGAVDRLAGGLSIDGMAAGPSAIVESAQLLSTGTGGGASLLLNSGASLRMDASTDLRFTSARQIRLQRGRLYIDTDGVHRDVQFEVITPAATIRDIGTQFEVYTEERNVRVRVRDGEVLMDTGGEALSAQRGEALSMQAGSRVERSSFSPVDPQWEWAAALAPRFETNNATVSELVDWVARETGREVAYSDPRTRNAAATTRISGSIDDLSPEQTLSTALAATRFVAVVEHEAVVIARRR